MDNFASFRFSGPSLKGSILPLIESPSVEK